MGRERERKSIVQQLWQAKNKGGATASAAPKLLKKCELPVVYEHEEEAVEEEQEEEESEALPRDAGDAMRGSAYDSSAGASLREQQARTKVVVRHLPPLLSEQVFLEQFESKYGDKYTWMAFYPGKISHRRQIQSRVYINFKSPETVVYFHEDFDGHIFVSERGAQFKAVVEYAPHQRTPALPLKKDVREGSIFKDPEYSEFLELLAKPIEHLPSAEVQLERREAEKAASLAAGGVKDPVIVTPLMEYVRHRRAAKAAPQRSNSFSGKSSLRGVAAGASPKRFSAKKRGAVRSKANMQMLSTDSTVPAVLLQKEVNALLSTKEEYHGNREAAARKHNERDEVNVKKASHETASSVPTLRGDSIHETVDCTNELSVRYSPQKVLESIATDGQKDGTRKEILRRKQSVEKVKEEVRELGHGFPSYSNKESGAVSQKHSPFASTIVASPVQQQHGVSSPGGRASINMASKQIARRESARKFSRGAVIFSKDQGPPAQQELFTPESKVLADAATSNSSSVNLISPASGSERQDIRRVKNKDRPDRPVWTPRRRADNPQVADCSIQLAASIKSSESLMGSNVSGIEKGDKSFYNEKPAQSGGEKESEQQHIRRSLDYESIDGSHGSVTNSVGENSSLVVTKPASRGDRFISGAKEYNGITVPPDGGKSFKRAGGPVVFTANEKQMWVAKSTSGP